MAINYATKKNSEKTKEKKGLGMTIVFYALNFLLVPFSAYQTYAGYSEFLGQFPAIILAAVSGLIFFGLNYTIKERRVNGQRHIFHVFGYLLPLCISLPGNFNSIYGAQMQETLFADEVTHYSGVLKNTFSQGESALDASTGLSKLNQELNSHLNSLKSQMSFDNNPPNYGYGSRAKQDWAKIENLFADYNNQYKGASGGLTEVYITKYANFESTAKDYFKTIEDQKLKEINSIIVPQQKIYDDAMFQFDTITKNKSIKTEGYQLLETLRKANNEIGTAFSNYVSDTTKYNYETLGNSDERQVGTIKHSLESAFVKFENPSATFFGTFFSLIIDLIPLGFLFLVFSYAKNGGRKERVRHTTL